MGDIVEVIAAIDYLRTLSTAINASGLTETLKGKGPYTVFAPTNDAFAKLPEKTTEQLMKDAPELKALINSHVVEGKIAVAALVGLKSVKNVQGQEIDVDASRWHLHSSVKVGGADIVKADVQASNGVIHVIDKVLLLREPRAPVPESYQVKSYMIREFHTISSEASVVDAAASMAADVNQEGYAIVLEAGKPVGIITENDIVNKVVAKTLDPATTKVNQVMSSPLITIDPDIDLLEASEFMRKRGIRKLIVAREEIVYGVITASDIARACGNYVDKSVRDIVLWTAPLAR